MKKQHFLLALLFYAVAVFYLAYTTPISPHEAKIFYTSQDVVGTLNEMGKHLCSGLFRLKTFLPFVRVS